MKVVNKIKSLFISLIKKMLFDYKNPRYSTFIYHISRQYVNYYRNDQNGDIEINGELRFMNSLNLDGATVFDVGANVGDYTKHLPKTADIHCFEPDKDVFQILVKKFPSVSANNIALGSAIGKHIIYKNPNSSGLNSFYDMSRSGDLYNNLIPTEIQVSTLDQYCVDNRINSIDLLKIDVEGHELHVLVGGGRCFPEKQLKIYNLSLVMRLSSLGHF